MSKVTTSFISFTPFSGQNSSTYYTYLDSTYGTKVKQINFEQIRNYGINARPNDILQKSNSFFPGTGYFAEDNNLDEDTIEITALYTNAQKPEETDSWSTFIAWR